MERILVLGMSKDCGGIENYILNLYEHIDLNKIQFDFLSKEDIGDEFRRRIEKLGGHIYTIGTFKNNMLKVWRNLNNFYKEQLYTKIYINMSYAPTLIYILPALRNGLEILYMHSHASKDVRIVNHKIFRLLFINILLHRTKCVYMGCSEEACRWMYGNRVLKRKSMYIINNAVDYCKFSYSEDKRQCIRKKYQFSDSFVVGHVGRFSPEKNHVFIIEAFKCFNQMVPNSILLLVGDGKKRECIEELVRQYDLLDSVIFIGNVIDTSFYYNAMDCFWLPSIYEGFPMVAVEAQANGLQCMFSDSIDRGVDILGNSIFAKIDNPYEWALRTTKIAKNYDRKVESSVWRDTGYDLNEQANTVERLLDGELL